MKSHKILVPTDFSVFSDFALDAAIEIGKKHSSEIHLYHSADIPEDWEDLSAEKKYKDQINRNIALKVKEKLEAGEHKIKEAGLQSSKHFTGGNFLHNINEILLEVDFDLIIMGSHGTSGKEEWFIGSNAQKVVRKIHKNVLVVKQPLKSNRVENVVFVTGLNKSDHEAFRNFLKFLEPFDVKELNILSVDTSSFFIQPTILMKSALQDFANIAKDFNVKTHFFKDFTVEAGVRHFSAQKNIDLIGVSNHSRHRIKRLFQGSNVEMIVNHSQIPVLSIDY